MATCSSTSQDGRATTLASDPPERSAPVLGRSAPAVAARLFSAGEPEQIIERLDAAPTSVGEKELLWVDLNRGDDDELTRVLDRFDMADAADHVRMDAASLGVVQMDDLVALTVYGLRLADARAAAEPARVDVIAKGNVVVTIEEAETAGLRNLVRSLQGTSELGTLTAASFAAVLIDGLVSAFFEATEDIERDIDELDDRALRAAPGRVSIRELVVLRRRIAVLRRTLSPHRGLIAALARPELGLTPADQDPWPGVLERLERAIDAVEHARELLLGSFDLAMTRTAQRTNDIVRVLTVVSVGLLPAAVMAGIFGMNFQSPIFEAEGMLLPAIGFIAAVSVTILFIARWRGWL